MSRTTSNQSGGNDGTWFLEAIGQTKAPTASEVVADLEAENTIAEDPEIAIDLDQHAETEERAVALVAANSFDGNPGTSTSSFDPVPAPPPPPPEVTEDHDPLGALLVDAPPVGDDETFDDTELSPALRSKRNFRWPVVFGLLLAIALVAAAAIILPARVEFSDHRHGTGNLAVVRRGVRDRIECDLCARQVVTHAE